jgi:hypothetical protein
LDPSYAWIQDNSAYPAIDNESNIIPSRPEACKPSTAFEKNHQAFRSRHRGTPASMTKWEKIWAFSGTPKTQPWGWAGDGHCDRGKRRASAFKQSSSTNTQLQSFQVPSATFDFDLLQRIVRDSNLLDLQESSSIT